MAELQIPMGTGGVTRLLDVPDHRINAKIRSHAITAPPPIAGRRLWSAREIIALAEALEVKLPPAKLRALQAAARREGNGDAA